MKNWLCYLFVLFIAVKGYGQQPASADVHIAKFNGDRVAAICYSFDDGIKDQYTLAFPLLEKYGFHATFFIIPSKVIDGDDALEQKKAADADVMTWAQIKEMAAHGHEIASHTWSHKNLKTLNDQEMQKEINKADSMITAKTGAFPLTLAYPWNSFDDRVNNAVLKNHIATREFQFGMGSKFTTAMGNSWIDGLIKKQGWGIVMTHAISKGFDTLSSPKILDDHFQYVKQLQSQIWVATFAELSKYNKERDSTILTATWSKNKAELHFDTHLDAKTYNQPLTIVIDLKGVKSVVATQHGRLLSVKSDTGKVLIDAIPTAGNINLKWLSN